MITFYEYIQFVSWRSNQHFKLPIFPVLTIVLILGHVHKLGLHKTTLPKSIGSCYLAQSASYMYSMTLFLRVTQIEQRLQSEKVKMTFSLNFNFNFKGYFANMHLYNFLFIFMLSEIGGTRLIKSENQKAN